MTRSGSKIAVVVGATGNIGSELVRRFASSGMNVVAVGRNVGKLDALNSQRNQKIKTLQFDCSHVNDVKEVVEWTEGVYGRADLLVTSVGSWKQIYRDSTPEKFEEQLYTDTNSMLKAAVTPIFVFNQYFRQNGSGFIVDISSHAAEGTLPGNLTYSIAKSGVKAFIENLREENGVGSSVVISRIVSQLVDTPQNRAAFPDVPESEWKGAVQISDIAKWIIDNVDNIRAAPEKTFKSSIVIKK